MDFGWGGGVFGIGSERDDGLILLGEVKIGNEWCGGALNTGDVERFGHETGKAQSRIFGRVFLGVGGLVRFVDDDKTEIMERAE